MSINSDLIRTNRWRQGSVFSIEDGRAVIDDRASNARLILVSHDCDIVYRGTREPVVEICVAQPQVRLDGNYARGKNPRMLHVGMQIGRIIVPHSLESSDRRWIDRSLLERMIPAEDAAIAPEELRVIKRWLAKRYDRAALPDRFNERLVPALEEIRLALRDDGSKLSGIMIALETEGELQVNEDYRLVLVGLSPKEIFEMEEGRASGLRAIGRVAAAMNGCRGIEVIEFSLESEDEFTLHDLHMVIEYSCEDLSLGENEGAPAIPRA